MPAVGRGLPRHDLEFGHGQVDAGQRGSGAGQHLVLARPERDAIPHHGLQLASGENP